jgi:hypothetical protein
MLYSIREKMAYSAAGKIIAKIIRDKKYPHARIHWVQQSLADFDFTKLPK